ncbi:MAG: ThuA domain-containing protein [Planctomycetota bacterium]
MLRAILRVGMIFGTSMIALLAETGAASEQLRVLIVDGQNNHDWKTTTPIIKSILEECDRFDVEVATSPAKGEDLSSFRPTFSDYDVVVSNYNGAPWSEDTQNAFAEFVEAGGGFVSVHAADNAFPQWEAYNRMIGLGGWNQRNERSGPYVYYDDQEQLRRDDSPGPGGHHGAQHEFQVIIRNPDHPITQGMPRAWMHTKDELYERLRGPAVDLEVLATAYASPEFGGSDRHEPMAMVISFGEGRVFHLALGHADYSMQCVGFANLLQRGTEWAASGAVTIPVAENFPSATEVQPR